MIKTFLETFKGRGVKPALLLKTNKVDYSLLDKEEILKHIRDIRNQFDNKEISQTFISYTVNLQTKNLTKSITILKLKHLFRLLKVKDLVDHYLNKQLQVNQ
jgi:predicted solute-binding protein